LIDRGIKGGERRKRLPEKTSKKCWGDEANRSHPRGSQCQRTPHTAKNEGWGQIRKKQTAALEKKEKNIPHE